MCGDLLRGQIACVNAEEQPAEKQAVVVVSSKVHITKRLLQDIPMFARAAVGQSLLKMQVTENMFLFFDIMIS